MFRLALRNPRKKEKERFEMVIGIQNEILDGENRSLFSNEPFENKPVMTMEDFVLCFDDHFESHLLGERAVSDWLDCQNSKNNHFSLSVKELTDLSALSGIGLVGTDRPCQRCH